MIKAKIHSDDHVYQFEFDATDWFLQATDEEIKELSECDFGGDLPADRIAYFFEDKNSSVEILLDYCQLNPQGFECHINVEDATSFINENSPD